MFSHRLLSHKVYVQFQKQCISFDKIFKMVFKNSRFLAYSITTIPVKNKNLRWRKIINVFFETVIMSFFKDPFQGDKARETLRQIPIKFKLCMQKELYLENL